MPYPGLTYKDVSVNINGPARDLTWTVLTNNHPEGRWVMGRDYYSKYFHIYIDNPDSTDGEMRIHYSCDDDLRFRRNDELVAWSGYTGWDENSSYTTLRPASTASPSNSANTQYRVRVFIEQENVTEFTKALEFRTYDAKADVTALPTSEIGGLEATLNAHLNCCGPEEAHADVWFYIWEDVPNAPVTNVHTEAAQALGADVGVVASGLGYMTEYKYAVAASNDFGIA